MESGEWGMEYGVWIIDYTLGCVRLSARPDVSAGGLLEEHTHFELQNAGGLARRRAHTPAARSDQVRLGLLGLAAATSRSVPSGKRQEEMLLGVLANVPV